jgi:hypothetical protein
MKSKLKIVVHNYNFTPQTVHGGSSGCDYPEEMTSRYGR